MLKQKLKDDIKEAMKTGKAEQLVVLRGALAAISSKETEKRYQLAKENPSMADEELASKALLADEEIITVISSEVKKRRDAIALYEEGGRPELAQKEQAEISLLQKYLPEQLSLEELKKLAAEAMATTGAKELKDMGKVMAELNPKIKGKADGSEAAKIVKELLK